MVFIVFIGTVFSALIKSGLRRLIDRSLFRYVLRKVDVSHSNNEKSSLLSYDFLMASEGLHQAARQYASDTVSQKYWYESSFDSHELPIIKPLL